MGEVGASQEPAIVVSGLKPDHFYNIRVIAVGSNNFQAGSQVVRLRTYGRDGRPQLGNGRLPTSFREEDQVGVSQGEHDQENGGAKSLALALETATNPEPGMTTPREGNISAGSGTRRNTLVRRHSPSITSIDQLQTSRDEATRNDQSLPELTERFEDIRRETEETIALICKEESENERLLTDLENDKAKQKGEREKKDAQTNSLRQEVNASDRDMRQALNRKAALERKVKEKVDEKVKMEESMSNMEKEIREFKEEAESFGQQRRDLERERDKSQESLREKLQSLQDACTQLEAQLKDKREKVKELEYDRKKLPGGNDADYRETDFEVRRLWQHTHRALQDQLTHLQRANKHLEDRLRVLGNQVQHIPAQNVGMYSQVNSSVLDLDYGMLPRFKRRSRTSNSMSNTSTSSPLPPYSQVDPAVLTAGPPGFAGSRAATYPPGFAPGPFMRLSADGPRRLDESGPKMTSAQLSPSATALLPSNILDDLDDDEGPGSGANAAKDSFPGIHNAPPDDDAQSPTSSARSMSILSSPHGSSHNLPFPTGGAEKAALHALRAPVPMSPPHGTDGSTNKLGHLFTFQRPRARKGGMNDSGPALGSLKHGQSHSFPRQTDETEATKRKWAVFNRSSAGPELLENMAPTSRQQIKSWMQFGHQRSHSLLPDGDSSSPRPASIASSEFPRPSTDAGSIWGPPEVQAQSHRLWSPESFSRHHSRRPSLHLHGSASPLKTTLASEHDVILPGEDVPDVSQVGVIGSRLPAASKSFGRLNPDAPAFIGSFFKPKPEKDGKETGRDKEKARSKDKDKPKDRSKDRSKDTQGKSKAKDASAARPETPHAASVEVDSPSDARQSRDSFSLHTQTSVSESRDSVSLDQSVSNMSNTPSDPSMPATVAGSIKDEGVVRKLFRKGSSSKFGRSGRLGGKDAGSIFKKGPGSSANSEKGGPSTEWSSTGDAEETQQQAMTLGATTLSAADDASGFLARSYDSMTNSPNLGPLSSGNTNSAGRGSGSKEGKTSSVRWLSNFSKKGRKEKESLDLDQERTPESDAAAAAE